MTRTQFTCFVVAALLGFSLSVAFAGGCVGRVLLPPKPDAGVGDVESTLTDIRREMAESARRTEWSVYSNNGRHVLAFKRVDGGTYVRLPDAGFYELKE